MDATKLVAQALSARYPHLTEAECAVIATQIDRVVEAGRRGQWDMCQVTLMTKGGKSTPLATALQELREECGLTQAKVAQATEWSLSKVQRIESGQVRVSVTDVRALTTMYGLKNQKAIDSLLDLARRGRR